MYSDDTHKDSLIIGEGVRITGKVETAGLMQVHGTVDGEVRAKELRVGPTGRIEGALYADDVELRGYAGESINAVNGLTVRSSATLVGTIVYHTVEIESGASIRGKLEQHAEAPPRPVVMASTGMDDPAPDPESEGEDRVE